MYHSNKVRKVFGHLLRFASLPSARAERARRARLEHYEKRRELAADIRKDIDAICSIYPTIDMYDEPRTRLSERLSHRILGDWPG